MTVRACAITFCLFTTLASAQSAPAAPTSPALPPTPEAAPEPTGAAPAVAPAAPVPPSSPMRRTRRAASPGSVAAPQATPGVPALAPVPGMPTQPTPPAEPGEPDAPEAMPIEVALPAVPPSPQGDEDAVGDLRRAVERLRRSSLTPADRRKAARELQRLAEVLHRGEGDEDHRDAMDMFERLTRRRGEAAGDDEDVARALAHGMHEHEAFAKRYSEDAAAIAAKAEELAKEHMQQAHEHMRHLHELMESGQVERAKALAEQMGEMHGQEIERELAIAHEQAERAAVVARDHAEAMRARDAERAAADRDRERAKARREMPGEPRTDGNEGDDQAPAHVRKPRAEAEAQRRRRATPDRAPESAEDLRAMMDDLRAEMASVRELIEELKRRRADQGQTR